MKLSAIIGPLLRAKAPHDQIFDVVMAFEEQQDDALAQAEAIVEQGRAKARARVQRWRDKHRGNVTKRNVTGGNGLARAEDESLSSVDKPQKKESSLRSDRATARRASRLSADWVLPADWRQDAIEAGLPSELVDLESAKMRDWSVSAPAGAKLDWRAAWRNWCRSAAAKTTPNRTPPRAQRPTVVDAANQLLAEMSEAEHGRPSQDDRSDRAPAVPLSAAEYRRIPG